MRTSYVLIFLFCLFSPGCSTDLEHYCEGETGLPVIKLEGTKGDFYRKVKTVTTIHQDTLDLICTEIGKLNPTFSNAKGSHYRITFWFVDSKSSKRPIEVYWDPGDGFVFWIGVKYFKNDTLARLLAEIIDVDEVRHSEKFRIEAW